MLAREKKSYSAKKFCHQKITCVIDKKHHKSLPSKGKNNHFVDETFTESFSTQQIKISGVSLGALVLPEVSTQHYPSG